MLVFRFNLQKNIKEKLVKKQKNGMRIAASIIFLLFFIPATILLAVYNNSVSIVIAIGLILFALLFLILFSWWENPFNAFYKSLPDKIIIDKEQGTIITTGLAQYSYKSVDLELIKEIFDFGDWYEIKFYYPYGSMFFICQKDLIEEGTIEDFECMFKEKIIRKLDF